MLSRRDALGRLAWIAAGVGVACTPSTSNGPDANGARITSRPGTPTTPLSSGLHNIDAFGLVLGQLYVPPGYSSNMAAPLFVMFHGAGAHSNELMDALQPLAESRGILLLAIESISGTWDYINGRFGLDVGRTNAALAWTFQRCNVDGTNISAVGFSDGGSYVLALGRRNGDFFRRVVAFSPGFVRNDLTPIGLPSFFISHGTEDTILNIDSASRVIVPALRNAGYSVTYREFPGGHGATEAIIEEAVDWAASRPQSAVA